MALCMNFKTQIIFNPKIVLLDIYPRETFLYVHKENAYTITTILYIKKKKNEVKCVPTKKSLVYFYCYLFRQSSQLLVTPQTPTSSRAGPNQNWEPRIQPRSLLSGASLLPPKGYISRKLGIELGAGAGNWTCVLQCKMQPT